MGAGLKNTPTFDMFFPTYINDLEAFTVRMPSTYVEILLTLKPFTCGDIVKFLLEPREYERKGKDKKQDTGDFWAHVSMHPHSVMSQADIFAFIKNQFWRVALNPVSIEPHTDKNKGGTGTNKIRVGFLPTEAFDVRNLKTLHELTAPDGFFMHTRISNKAGLQFNVHETCLGVKDKRAHWTIRCNCGDDEFAKAGSSSGPSRAKAAEAYQQRALKRAREDADPFA
jgi:hypothetical protein